MDVEHLNKSQLILLTLLVSFVTSIATGIVTVSLMEEAPPVVAQTVNRIVERTVEKVVPETPSKNQGAAAATVVTRETTKIVKETDLIPQAVARIGSSVVRVFVSGEAGAFLAMGVVRDSQGTISTDASAIGENAAFSVGLSDGTRVTGLVVARDEKTGVATIAAATSTEKGPIAWKPAASGAIPAFGSTVITIGGSQAHRIGSGLISSPVSGSPRIIETNLSSAVVPGAPLVDTDGVLIGVSTGISRASGENAFMEVR